MNSINDASDELTDSDGAVAWQNAQRFQQNICRQKFQPVAKGASFRHALKLPRGFATVKERSPEVCRPLSGVIGNEAMKCEP
jgi:hypothetical protein